MKNRTNFLRNDRSYSAVLPLSSTARVSLVSIYFYLTVVCFALFARIFVGFYLSDLLVLLFLTTYLITGRLRYRIRYAHFFMLAAALLFLPALFSLIVQLLFFNAPVSSYSFYIPYNCFLGFLYVVFMFQIVESIKVYPSFLLTIFAIPVLLSFAAHLYTPLQIPLKYLYQIESMYRQTDPWTLRFGGVFGFDVNQLGYYSALVIVLALFLNYKFNLSKIIFYAFLLISIYCSLLSGMRLGLYLLLPLVFFLYFIARVKVFSLLDVLCFSLSSLAAILFIDLANVYRRFSVNVLVNDLFSGDAHVSGMYVKWYKMMIVQNNDILSLLFACYPEWKHPDSLVIFLLGNGGLFGLFCYLLLFFLLGSLLALSSYPKDSKWFIFVILLFNFGAGLKGNYPFNNGGMFIFSFIVVSLFLMGERRAVGQSNL